MSRFQHQVLRLFHPLKPLAWPVLLLGALSFPGVIGLAAARPDLSGDRLFIGFVAGLAVLLLGILLAMSRPEAPPAEGIGNRLRRWWETLVFWAWLVCLLAFASLAVKITTFNG